MGESLISRRGNVNGDGGGALVKVNTIVGVTITCTCGSTTRRKTASEEVVEFTLGYGTWIISAEIEGKTYSKTLVIEILQVYEITLKGCSTFGIAIDMNESDPEAAVTYLGDAAGFTPLTNSNYGSWTDLIKEFFGCRPCLYNGSVVGYLDPNDYSKFEDGSAADITSGSSGNVMVEFKKLYYKYELASGDTILTFKVTDDESAVDDGYTCTAFKSMDGTGTVKDYMYYGAYEGYNSNSVLKSLSGKTVTRSVSYTNFRNYCQANGSTYGMEDWAKRYYILGLLMLVTKTRGIQEVIGNGICDSNSAITTGTMNTRGLFYGGTSSVGVKAFGIENLWGNYYEWCDGIITLSSSTLGFKDCAPYNDSGSGYTSVADGYTRDSGLYPTKMKPVMNGAAITAWTGQSDSSIGWCDYWYVGSGSGLVAYVGGYYVSGSVNAGPFCAYVYGNPSDTNSTLCARVVAS